MFGKAKWKREEVPDHKFDFVDTREFTDNGCGMRTKYAFVYVLLLKTFLVYVSDIFTAITMLTTEAWSNQIFQNCASQKKDEPTTDGELEDGDTCIFIPFSVGKWLFVGCIIFSFLLLAYEARKAKKIIASRDISFAITNPMASDYYSIRSYSHFCFFDHISDSTKTSDDFAFFVFFTFKSWKRLLLADGPRQTINALTLYAIYLSKRKEEGEWYDVSKYFRGNPPSTTLITATTVFTVLIFVGSLLLLVAAALCYIPLLCHIRGNLKEYCCHQVDKRVGSVIKRRQKARLAEIAKLEQKEANGDFSHLKNDKGEIENHRRLQPTLPNLSVEDDFSDRSSVYTRYPASSTHKNTDQYYYDQQGGHPSAPGFNPYSHTPHSSQPHNPSVRSFAHDDVYQQNFDYDDTASTTHLALSAAPMGYNPHDVYTGQAPLPPALHAQRTQSIDAHSNTPPRGYDEEHGNGRAL